MDFLKKHRSHISGKKRWIKSKLAQRRVENFTQRLRKINGKNHKKEVISHEKTKSNRDF